MIRKLFRTGNGYSLFVPKVIIELLKIDPDKDSIEMEIENDVLKIKKLRENPPKN
jgi:antitoxin component of MazEF toxin-antitoxin module